MKHDVSLRFAAGRDMLVLTIEDLRRGVDCPSKMTWQDAIRIEEWLRRCRGAKLLPELGVLRHCSSRRGSANTRVLIETNKDRKRHIHLPPCTDAFGKSI